MLGSLLTSTISVADSLFAPRHDEIAYGETRLSTYFSIKLSGGGWFSPRILKTYHHDGDDKQLIGICKFSEHASRQNGYAISDDGKTLLYFHQKLPNQSDIVKPGGLYEYRHGGDDKLLRSYINNSAYLPVKLPGNTLVFTQLNKRTDIIRMDSKVYLRDTNGNEKLWQQ